MEELIQEFREWNRSWDLYHEALGTPRHIDKPIDVDTLIKQLNIRYKVTKV